MGGAKPQAINLKKLSETLSSGITSMVLSVATDVQAKLLAYVELLHKWNNAFNLTAVRDPHEMVIRHLLDSLSIAPYIHGQCILDIGSGAGLPGIPLALLFPQAEFVLLDSNGKKTRFLLQAQQTLAISNIAVINTRVETFVPAQGFDSILSRAFGTLSEMVNLSQHLLNTDGQFLAMKGIYPEAEIAELPKDFLVHNVIRLHVPGLEGERHLIGIKHIAI